MYMDPLGAAYVWKELFDEQLVDLSLRTAARVVQWNTYGNNMITTRRAEASSVLVCRLQWPMSMRLAFDADAGVFQVAAGCS